MRNGVPWCGQTKGTDKVQTHSHELLHLLLFHPALQLTLLLCIEPSNMGSVSKRPSTLEILLGFAVLVLTRPFYRFQQISPATAIKRDPYVIALWLAE